jgi:hypothetical protein
MYFIFKKKMGVLPPTSLACSRLGFSDINHSIFFLHLRTTELLAAAAVFFMF